MATMTASILVGMVSMVILMMVVSIQPIFYFFLKMPPPWILVNQNIHEHDKEAHESKDCVDPDDREYV